MKTSPIYTGLLAFWMTFLSVDAISQTLIANESDLRKIADDPTGSYVLANDIDLSQNWEPVALFKGTLDGKNHKIRNLKINNTGIRMGFFSQTDGAVICNLGIENAEVSGGRAGGFHGILIGEAKATQISQTYISGSLTAKGQAGAFIGRSNNTGSARSQLTDCYSTAQIATGAYSAGGIVGSAINTDVQNTYFAGTITAGATTGGIIGTSEGGNSVANCLVASLSLQGTIAGRIAGEKKSGTLVLTNNYANRDLLLVRVGGTAAALPVTDSSITGIQGENVLPESMPEYQSAFPAFTEADATSALTALRTRYYSPSRRLFFERTSLSGTVAAIWTEAIFFDIVMNAYKRTGDADYSTWLNDLYLGNGVQYANYDWNNGEKWFIYDDIMWWVITLARYYEQTQDVTYLTLSKTGFERVWSGSPVIGDLGSYDPVAGGMYWRWRPEAPTVIDNGKMACINYPTVIAAMTLYNATQEATYLNKAKEIYGWARANLFDTELGRVADSRHGTGSPAWALHVYNQATCIGAAMMLYKETGERLYLDDAILTANYTKNRMSTNGLLPFETGVEQGIYNAIFAQYIIRLIEDGEQYQYLPWLRYNIDTAWGNRLSRSNITYKDHANPAPNISRIDCYDASGIPAFMQVIPPAGNNEKEVHAKSPLFYEKNLHWDMENIWHFNGDDTYPVLKTAAPTGMSAPTANEKSLYAYSTNGQLVIETNKAGMLELYNPAGRMLQRRACQSHQEFNLPKGVYIVRATGDGLPVTKKVINY